MEQLAKEKQKFDEEEIKRHDKISELRQKLSDANRDIKNEALDEYGKVMQRMQEAQFLERRQQLSDYYKPSDEMKEYQYLFTGISGLAGGLLLSAVV